MKIGTTYLVIGGCASSAIAAMVLLTACDADKRHATSDEIQRKQQETILEEGTAQVGMPAIKNFRERKMVKDLYELRDQDGLATFTYTFAENSGQLRFFCNSIGYGIPYAVEFTNPQRMDFESNQHGLGAIALPQADPNGLFSPPSADGTWVMCKDPGGPDVRPVYIEPRVIVSPFKLAE